MEPKCNNPSHQQSKRSKTTHLQTQIPTTSTLSSNTNPVFVFPQLPPEILSEILSRLPVKSLLRFRCVSKEWCALISSSHFVKLHLKASAFRKDYAYHKILSCFAGSRSFSVMQCSLQSVMSEPVTERFELDYPIKGPHSSVWFIGSCNGLVCIAIEDKYMFIWNPTTGKFKEVPDPGVKFKTGFYHTYGFGYDELNDDYKVVGVFCFFCTLNSWETEIMVYSMKGDCWRKIEDLIGGNLFNRTGKYANGKIHWPVRASSGWEIVSLDLAMEIFGKVEQPYYGEGYSELTLDLLCGSLCVLCRYGKAHVDLWVMREYGVNESWTKMITMPPLNRLVNPWTETFASPICISKNGEVVLVLGSTILVFDPKSKAFRCPKITKFGAFLEVYVESLVSPFADGEAGREQQQ